MDSMPPRTGRRGPSPWRPWEGNDPQTIPRVGARAPTWLGTGEGPGDLLGDLPGLRPPREVGWPSRSQSPGARR